MVKCSTNNKKILTPEQEIEDIKEFNKNIIKKYGVFYSLEFLSMSTAEFYQNRDKENVLISKIYNLQLNVDYRAKMFLFYKQFPIFIPLCLQINEATQCFFEKKYIATCFLLAPLIEGLLVQWNDGMDLVCKDNRNQFISSKISSIKSNSAWCQHNLEIFELFIKHYFEHSHKTENEIGFNRNSLLHLLKPVKVEYCLAYAINLFCALDLIATCYYYEQTEQGKKYLHQEDIIAQNEIDFFILQKTLHTYQQYNL